ncbi:MAG: hypothetical protein HQ594_01590 [Candidatus Omnitrophica bacterium]|nr:hypothetical protein [Candidatus Omnitrophota bacterium]
MPIIRRKKYLLLIRFQLKYILYILGFLYLGALISGYIVYTTAWLTLGEKLANVYPSGRLFYIWRSANVQLILWMLGVSPLFVVLGIFLSHRIAGPIYAIGKYIDKLLMGDYSHPLNLRKHDELKGLAVKVTEVRNKLKDDKEKREKNILEVETLIDSGDREGAKSKLQELKD